MRSYPLFTALTIILTTLGCDALRNKQPHQIVRSLPLNKRQNSNTQSAPPVITTTYAAFSGFTPGTCICLLESAFTPYTTVTSTYTASQIGDGTRTYTLALPTGTTQGTIEVLVPVSYVTVTATYTAANSPTGTNGGVSTSTVAQPIGTTPGTVQVITPVYFVTVTSTYTASNGVGANGGISTSTIAQPSGSVPGTVEILTPVSYNTITVPYTATGTRTGLITTTIANPSGSTPGTVKVLTPEFYLTTTIARSGLVSVITTTLADPTGTVPGTVEIIVPSATDYATSTQFYTGTDVVTTAFTTTLASPGVSQGAIKVIAPNYGVTTITSGTTGDTSILRRASGTSSGTVVVAIPTPDLSCDNHGIEYAIFSNPYTRGLQRFDPTYSEFSAVAFQTAAPQATGVTNYLGLPFVGRGTQASIYGNPPQSLELTAINHRTYLFAKISGQFTFDFTLSDDISLLWVGSNVYGPRYTRANANLEQLYNGGIAIDQQTTYTYNVTLTQGQYVPIRVLYANAEYDADFTFNIYAPDGELVTNSSTAFTFSPYVVRFSCDGVKAPRYVPFGAEG